MATQSTANQYFAAVAGQWDTLRQGYYTEEVRSTAIHKAHLHPQMVVADVGAGTGFMTAGLAPLVKQVYLLDGSKEMLEIARRNLNAYDNLVFQEADGLSLPLPDHSVDAVFANMYLHHIPDPLVAIHEMVRLLKPGGRVVITDMEAHPYAWLKTEMADVWQGFKRTQISTWFEQAGLVNRIVDCTGQSCCARSNCEATPAEERTAQISVFVAVGAKSMLGVEEIVGAHYSAIAEGQTCACSTAAESESCCSASDLITLEMIEQMPAVIDTINEKGYSSTELEAIPNQAAEISLGCGNPIAFATLQPGEVVLDIGSGGGIDVFLAARKVGVQGKVIGVDMTPAMLERARRSAAQAHITNVEFRQGFAETLPAEEASVDVIISNCVINLTADKGRVFQEANRVLRPGGRLEVSDIVTDRSFPPDWIKLGEAWGSCVTGALPEEEYTDLIKGAGFREVQVRRSQQAAIAGGVKVYSAQVSARK
jgi:arsenite methyltransferase